MEIAQIAIPDQDGNPQKYDVIFTVEHPNNYEKFMVVSQNNQENPDEVTVHAFRFTEENNDLQLYPLELEDDIEFIQQCIEDYNNKH